MLKEQNFGTALCALKLGKKVRRKGWNGKNMHLFLSYGGTYMDTDKRNKHQPVIQGFIHVLPRIDMCNAKRQQVIGWLASQEDMLAEDWQVMANDE